MTTITELELKALSASDVGTRLRDQGNLVGNVRFNRAGRIVVAFEYRYRSGSKTRSISVGTWPNDTLRSIRKQRDLYRVSVDQGIDPVLERRTAELANQARQAEELAREKARLDAIAESETRMTVSELFGRWEKLALVSRKDSGAEIRRMFEKDVLPQIGAMAVEDVKKRHIAAMLDKTKERGVSRMVNLLLSLTRQMFRFAVSRDWIESDPTAMLKKADFGGKEVERDRHLSEEEIMELAAKIPSARLSASAKAAIWIMISTCCRVGELSMAAWADVDVEKRQWRIPPENAKNGREHVIFLSDFALSQFDVLLKIQSSPKWVFPNRSGNDHIDEKTITKQIHDRQRAVAMKGRSRLVGTLRLSGGEWTPHDLRRTGSTLMGELGVLAEIIERCLNHVKQDKMARIYQRHGAKKEQAAAWKILGERLELLASGCSNIIPLSRIA